MTRSKKFELLLRKERKERGVRVKIRRIVKLVGATRGKDGGG